MMRWHAFVTTLCLGSALHASALLVDRGLPVTGINAPGPSRSNVAWGDYSPAGGYDWAQGDDFSVGTAGTVYNVTSLRVWIVGSSTAPAFSDIFSSLSLAGGLPGSGASASGACSSAFNSGVPQGFPCLDAGGINDLASVATTGDPNVAITQVHYAGGLDYLTSGSTMNNLWQVDFQNLNWLIQGGTRYTFFVSGVPGSIGNSAYGSPVSPFLSAANVDLGGGPSDGADNNAWELASQGSSHVAMEQWSSDPSYPNSGWDKGSDINVQVFGDQVPEPATFALFAGALGAIVIMRRKKALA